MPQSKSAPLQATDSLGQDYGYRSQPLKPHHHHLSHQDTRNHANDKRFRATGIATTFPTHRISEHQHQLLPVLVERRAPDGRVRRRPGEDSGSLGGSPSESDEHERTEQNQRQAASKEGAPDPGCQASAAGR